MCFTLFQGDPGPEVMGSGTRTCQLCVRFKVTAQVFLRFIESPAAIALAP